MKSLCQSYTVILSIKQGSYTQLTLISKLIIKTPERRH